MKLDIPRRPRATWLARTLAIVALAATAPAQVGTIDQNSPFSPQHYSEYGLSTLLTRLQQQVRPGRIGVLGSFDVWFDGPQGVQIRAAIRTGPAWSDSPPVFEQIVAKPTAGLDRLRFDASSAGLVLDPSRLFVIELSGPSLSPGVTVRARGNRVESPAPPLYPEPLQSSGQPGVCIGDCLSRLVFTTYLIDPPAPLEYCAGDGGGATCPCGNTSGPGSASGCLNSLGVGGRLAASGYPAISDDLYTLRGTQMPNSSALYFQGTQTQSGGAGVPFGDGLRCAGGAIVRIATRANVGGGSSYPAAGEAPISVRGGITVPGTRYYQVWYRNAASF